MATRFYFHSTTDATTGLPTTEQCTLTADVNSDALTLNRSMNTTIGTSQSSLALTSIGTTDTKNYYFGRFISSPLDQSGVAANTWTYNFAAKQTFDANNFPVDSTNKAVRVNCYVWRPSSSTKIGTILDGSTAATVDEVAQGTEAAHHVTFSGAAVASAAANDVIILEIWFITTQASAFAATLTFYYNGATVNTTDNATVSNHASFLETPENIALDEIPPEPGFRMYLHNATTSVSGTLPTTEQSTKTSTFDFESQATNRTMDTTIGTSMFNETFVITSNTAANRTLYVSRFISPPLAQSGIAANTWIYNFATKHSSVTIVDDYPTPDNNDTVPICCYVWRPSTGAKVGNILDGNCSSTYWDTGGFDKSTTARVAQHGTFAGAAVAGATTGDVIVLEAWTSVWTLSASAATLEYSYDGTTETLTSGTTVTNHAAFIETPEALTFGVGDINMTESAAKTYSNKFITQV